MTHDNLGYTAKSCEDVLPVPSHDNQGESVRNNGLRTSAYRLD